MEKKNYLRKVFIAVVVMLLVGWGFTGRNAEAAEALDFYLDVNVETDGMIFEDGDENVYHFSLAADGMIVINMKHENLFKETGWYVTLYDANNNKITEMEFPQNTEWNKSCEIGLPAGEYLIKIISRHYVEQTMVPYNLCVAFTESDAWEKESNNEGASATEIAVNKEYNGSTYIIKSSDFDWYKFNLAKQGMVEVNFRHFNNLDDTTGWYIWIYSSNMKEIISYKVPASGEIFNSCKLGLSEGEYYICIRDNAYSNVQGTSYKLTVNYEDSSFWESEDNQEMKDADAIEANQIYHGALSSYSDIDWYKADVPDKGYFEIDFIRENLFSKDKGWIIEVFDENLRSYGKLEAIGNEEKSKTPKTGVKAGTYYIKVSQLNYESSDKNYQIKFNFTGSNDWETENNDSMQTANALSLNKVINASLSGRQDLDYFKLTLTKKRYLQFVLTHEKTDINEKGWFIEVYDSKTNKLTRMESNLNEETCTMTATLDSGDYFIKVGTDTSWGRMTYSPASYALSVSTRPAAPSVTVKSAGSKSNTISWNKVSGATGYCVYQSTDGKTYKKIATTSKLSYTAKDLKSGVKYYYKVRAYRTVNDTRFYSKYSDVKSIKK